jgi:hypothetical protein
MPRAWEVRVDYATANGTATAGSDYAATSGSLIFAPGETTQTVLVPILGDRLDEADETFFLNLSNAGNVLLADSQGVGTVADDDLLPALSISDVAVAEGNAGTKTVTFTVSLAGASGRTVTVQYATADGTAAAGSDYGTISGTLTFFPGVTALTLSVVVSGDTATEAHETFFVNLTNPTNATLADGQGRGTILNDDEPAPGGITSLGGIFSGRLNQQMSHGINRAQILAEADSEFDDSFFAASIPGVRPALSTPNPNALTTPVQTADQAGADRAMRTTLIAKPAKTLIEAHTAASALEEFWESLVDGISF